MLFLSLGEQGVEGIRCHQQSRSRVSALGLLFRAVRGQGQKGTSRGEEGPLPSLTSLDPLPQHPPVGALCFQRTEAVGEGTLTNHHCPKCAGHIAVNGLRPRTARNRSAPAEAGQVRRGRAVPARKGTSKAKSADVDGARRPPRHPHRPRPSGCCCHDNRSRKSAALLPPGAGSVERRSRCLGTAWRPGPRPPAPAPLRAGGPARPGRSAPLRTPPHLPPLTHPWHPNWLRGAASPLLGLLLPLLLLLPPLPPQRPLPPPSPSATPWPRPRHGKRPGGGRAGSPRNDPSGGRGPGPEAGAGSGRVARCPPHPRLRKAAPVEGAGAGGPRGPGSGVAVLSEGRQLRGCRGQGRTSGRGTRAFRPSSGRGALSGFQP